MYKIKGKLLVLTFCNTSRYAADN